MPAAGARAQSPTAHSSPKSGFRVATLAALALAAVLVVLVFNRQAETTAATPTIAPRHHVANQVPSPPTAGISAASTPVQDPNAPIQRPTGISVEGYSGSSCPCKDWELLKYVPSELEEKWRRNALTWWEDTCKHVKDDMASFDAWISFMAEQRGTVRSQCPSYKAGDQSVTVVDPVFPPPPLPAAKVVSSFEYKCTCGVSTVAVPIEPLAGPMRHPYACKDFHKYLLDRKYLMVDGWAVNANLKPGGRALYFDVGASSYKSGLGGPSQGWFLELYGQRCARVESMWAWEMKPIPTTRVFQELPGGIKPIYHWFNVPASPDRDSWDNPLNHIKAVATKEDFVVMKLDIDTTPVEEAIIDYLLDSPELLGLVDEVFWEHHVNFAPMNTHWSTEKDPRHRSPPDSFNTSLSLFRRLREAGVRAHSWT